jgi:hypothetical protein
MSRRVLNGNSHRPVDLSAQLAAIVLEPLGQGWNFGRPTLGLVEQGGDEAVPGRSGREHHMPRLDVGVRRRARARASFTNSRGTGRGKNIRVEWRSLIV